jgi:hypothetical protein
VPIGYVSRGAERDAGGRRGRRAPMNPTAPILALASAMAQGLRRPRWARLRSLTGCSKMAAMVFSAQPQLRQCSRSKSKTRLNAALPGPPTEPLQTGLSPVLGHGRYRTYRQDRQDRQARAPSARAHPEGHQAAPPVAREQVRSEHPRVQAPQPAWPTGHPEFVAAKKPLPVDRSALPKAAPNPIA